MNNAKKHRIVTMQQLSDGYVLFRGPNVIPNVTRHRYEVVTVNADGSAVVIDPDDRLHVHADAPR